MYDLLSSSQIEEQKYTSHAKLPTPPSDDTPSSEKRKLADTLEKSTNPKLQEFLEVMQPPSKSKIWANEGAAGSGANSIPIVESVDVPRMDDGSEEDYEPVPKKRRRSPLAVSQPEKTPSQEMVRSAGEIGNQSPDITTKDSENKNLPVPPELTLAASSDVDWLRSRTSRLLGLVDDDDAITPNLPTTENNNRDKIIVNTKPHKPEMRTSEAGSQTDEIRVQGVEDTDNPHNDHPENRIEESSSTGRLFVRNLSYATSVDDLRAHFSNYGALAEVSALLYF